MIGILCSLKSLIQIHCTFEIYLAWSILPWLYRIPPNSAIVVLDLFFQAVALLSTQKAMQSFERWLKTTHAQRCEKTACQILCSSCLSRKPFLRAVFAYQASSLSPTSNDEQQQIKVQRVLNPHPRKSTWNPKMEVWKMMFLFNWVIFRFQPLIFQGVLLNALPAWFDYIFPWASESVRPLPSLHCWSHFGNKRSTKPPSGDWMRGRFSPIAYAHLIETIPSIQVHFIKVRIIMIQLHEIQGFQFLHVIWSHDCRCTSHFLYVFLSLEEASLAKGCDSTANSSRIHCGLLSLVAFKKVESFSCTWRNTSHLTCPNLVWLSFHDSWCNMLFTIWLTKPQGGAPTKNHWC